MVRARGVKGRRPCCFRPEHRTAELDDSINAWAFHTELNPLDLYVKGRPDLFEGTSTEREVEAHLADQDVS